MTDICYPPGADWTCAYTTEQLEEMRADTAILATMERAEALAWLTLASLTAYQIGTCPITVRPCAAGCLPAGSYMESTVTASNMAGVTPQRIGSFAPHINAVGNWVNSCGCGSGDCSCTSICEAILPGPVGSIVEVRLDGAILDRSAYRVDNGDRLVRTDGGCWPACQDMGAPTASYEPVVVDTGLHSTTTFTRVGDLVTVHVVNDHPEGVPGANFTGTPPWTANSAVQKTFLPGSVFTISQEGTSGPSKISGGGQTDGWDEFTLTYFTDDPPTMPDQTGTFSVTYYRGAAPNALSLWIAGVMANEFYLACSGGDCRLPANVTAVARQGVSYTLEPTSFPTGYTGIAEVDAFIRIFNPNGLKRPARVVSPDARGPRLTTWSGV